jgi:hypothetical protein
VTAIYDRFAARSAALLAKYGQTVRLTRAAGGYQDIKGLEETHDDKSIDGRVVERGDVKLHLAVTDITGAAVAKPESDADRITYADGTVWLVKNACPTAPGGQVVLYTLQLRR